MGVSQPIWLVTCRNTNHLEHKDRSCFRVSSKRVTLLDENLEISPHNEFYVKSTLPLSL
jgi:hypothetical protein